MNQSGTQSGPGFLLQVLNVTLLATACLSFKNFIRAAFPSPNSPLSSSQGSLHAMDPDGGRDGLARQLATVQALRHKLLPVVLKALCSTRNGGRDLVHRHPSRPSRKPLPPLSRAPLAADAAEVRVQAAVPRLDRVVVVNGVLGDVGLRSAGWRRRRRQREGSEQRARALPRPTLLHTQRSRASPSRGASS